VVDNTGPVPTCLPFGGDPVPGTACEYVSDPAGDYVQTQLICPGGQTALQNGCLSGGNEAITATLQNIGTVECYIEAPPRPSVGWITTVAAVCVDLELVNVANGAKLVSTLPKLTAGRSRASIRASLAGN